jgi:hypothetical protein
MGFIAIVKATLAEQYRGDGVFYSLRGGMLSKKSHWNFKKSCTPPGAQLKNN